MPKNLRAHVPAELGDYAAAFTVVGATDLEAVRLAAPTPPDLPTSQRDLTPFRDYLESAESHQ